MKTPVWLNASGLVLWAFASGNRALGIGLAVILLAAALPAFRRTLHPAPSDRDACRVVDIAALAVGLVTVGLLVAKGVSAGLLLAAGWLPATLSSVILFSTATTMPMRLRHLAYSQRRSTRVQADRVVDVPAAYLAITLLSAGILAPPSGWFFWAMAALVIAWLFIARAASYRGKFGSFISAVLIATTVAFVASAGLERGHSALQQWIVDALTHADNDPYQSQTRIGDVGRVKLDDRIVWRVDYMATNLVPLLLRTGVFTQFDDQTWIARHDAFKPVTGRVTEGVSRLIVRGESRQGAVLLPAPQSVGALGGFLGLAERNGYGIVRLTDAPPVLAATIAFGLESSPSVTDNHDLTLPPKYRALLTRLPELQALKGQSERQRLAGVEDWFAANFRYTLFLGDEHQGPRNLERFLLEDRAGHCEYFGTATVLLLRALGIPARYVTGYSLQEYSRLESAYVVRQKHAHAWAEAYLDGHWVEVDTTPATWLAEEEAATSIWQPLSDFFSFASWRFRQWRMDQGIDDPSDWLWLPGALLLLALVWPVVRRIGRTIGGNGLRSWLRNRPRRALAQRATSACRGSSADVLAFQALEEAFSAHGLGRARSEPPRAWLARVSVEGAAVIDPGQLIAGQRTVERLYRNLYR